MTAKKRSTQKAQPDPDAALPAEEEALLVDDPDGADPYEGGAAVQEDDRG